VLTEPVTAARLAEAMRNHQAGQLAEAEDQYRALLAEFPDDANVVHFLGVIRFQTGGSEEAVTLVKRSLEMDPDNAHAWNNLGNIYMHLQRGEEAEQAYRRAIALEPAAAPAWANLAQLAIRRSDPWQALTFLREATRARRGFTDALQALAFVYYRLGWEQQSREVYQQWLEEDPENPIPRHMVAANSGPATPSRANEGYIVKTFDEFAGHFDEKLKSLGYCAPQLAAASLIHHPLYQSGRAAVLDAGCGTGWCGPLLKSTAEHLVGVDLSPNMLEQARARGVYDELHEGELTAFMSSRPASFDIIVATDVLIYFGRLQEAFAAAQGALRSGGLFCFSVEALVQPAPAQDYRLHMHGRYSHSRAYLERALAEAGFPRVQIDSVVLRQELGAPVQGYVAVARLCGA